MPDQHKSDIVMLFVQEGNQPVYAECALDKDPEDTFMAGFKPQTYDNYSNFFQVTKFHFGVEVKDEDKTKSTLQSGNVGAAGLGKKRFGRVEGEFASWRSANDKQAPKVTYPLEFEQFSFERLIDAASPIFFEYCCNSTSFPSASLVKRLSRGNELPQGFLRIDFKDVLITSLSWDDGDMTTEKCEFICRDFDLTYRQHKADGSWGASGNATWNFKKNALPEP